MNEILAPCGGVESLAAALNAGADAVYVGMKKFSARKNAENFSDEELSWAIRECHKRGVKLYVTLNTLIYDDEIEEFSKCVETAAESGADGLIIQDLGAMYIAEKICPELPRHASTQMSLNSISGVKAAEQLGFARAVIGRELSEREIRDISENTDIELEIFVHGALCVCISGQCYMSSVLGGRSGSRGLCAQPCRLDFTCGSRHSVISLKDSSIIGHLRELPEIASFKIEGRMKRPEYVACAVDACRKSLDGEKYDKNRLGGIFSRGGLTDGYYTGKLNDMQGVRGKEDVENSAKALSGIKEIYKSEYPRISVDIAVKIGGKMTARAGCSYGEILVESDFVPEPASGSAIDETAVCERMKKLGGTQFKAGKITASAESGLYVSAAALNALRREICGRLEALVLEKNTPEYRISTFEYSHENVNNIQDEIHFRAEVYDENQLTQALELPLELVYAPMGLLSEKTPNKEKIVIIPPFVLSDCEEETERRLDALREIGFTKALAHTLGHAYLLKKHGFSVLGGFRMNVLNGLSARVCEDFGFEDITLSFEGTAQKLSEISCGIPRGIIAYGRLPLMIMRRCPIADGAACGKKTPFGEGKSCGGAIFDRLSNKIPVQCGGNSVELLNPDVLVMSDKRETLGKFDFCVLKFTDETDISPIFEMYKNGKKPSGKLTRGLYYRGAI
ncbi:MAG TPA: U32 family peptidase [Ruminococcaceae bacterium]|nr:U32 family peptidase [Oscillospiraceae bacterium]